MTTAVLTGHQTVRAWGNGLAIRITGPLAKAANLASGVPVTLEAVDGVLIVRPAGKLKLTLAQKLKLYDPAIHGGEHGGEFLPSHRIGREVF